MPSYNIDAYSAGSADMAMLPETIQLGQLQQMRQGLDKGAFDLRKAEREEQSVFREADEFQDFEKTMETTVGLSAPERDRIVADALARNPSWGSNQRITIGINEGASANRRVLQSQIDEAQAYELDTSFQTRDTRRETARINAELGLSQAKKAQADLVNLVDAQQLQNGEQLGSYLGSIGSVLDLETKDRLVEVGTYLSNDPASQGQFKGIGSIVSGFAASEGLLSTYASELSEYSPMLGSIKDTVGVNLDFNQPPEEFNAQYGKIEELVGSKKLNPQVAMQLRKAASMARKANALYSKVSELKGGMGEELKSLDPKDPNAVKVFVNKYNMRASQLSGAVNREISLKENQYSQQTRDMDMKKKILELSNLEKKPILEADKVKLAKDRVEVSRALMQMKRADAEFKILETLRENDSKFSDMDIDDQFAEAKSQYEKLIGDGPMGGGSGVSLLKKK